MSHKTNVQLDASIVFKKKKSQKNPKDHKEAVKMLFFSYLTVGTKISLCVDIHTIVGESLSVPPRVCLHCY